MENDKTQRSRRAVLAALARWAAAEPAANIVHWQAGFLAKVAREVREANPELPDSEVARRAAAARRAYLHRMVLHRERNRQMRKSREGP